MKQFSFILLTAIIMMFIAACELSKYNYTEVIEYAESYSEGYRTLGKALNKELEMMTPMGEDSDLEWVVEHKGKDVFKVTVKIVVEEIEQSELTFQVDMRKKKISGLDNNAEKILETLE